MKSGTSTLADYLAENTDIHIPTKEVHYFNNDKNYSQGSSWYEEQLVKNLDENIKSDNFILGEKTPTYSFQPNCAKRIKDSLPNVKLIWIFREPVKRTFSNYLHAKKKGVEPLSFRQCVKDEEKRKQENIFNAYIERSKYVKQVERFLEFYELSDMHFLLFEDLIKSPKEELNKISEFLGVSQFDNIHKVHSNKTVLPVYPNSLARKLGGLDSISYQVTRKISPKLASSFLKKNCQSRRI